MSHDDLIAGLRAKGHAIETIDGQPSTLLVDGVPLDTAEAVGVQRGWDTVQSCLDRRWKPHYRHEWLPGCQTRREATRLSPWARRWLKVTDGYMAFASDNDCKIWRGKHAAQVRHGGLRGWLEKLRLH